MRVLILIGFLFGCTVATVKAQSQKAGKDSTVKIRLYCADWIPVNKPLVIIDGKVSKQELNKINPKDILSINVMKTTEAVVAYGNKGQYGAILVTTKPKEKDKN